MLDCKQKFFEAGQRYAELSIRYPTLVSEADRMTFLERSLLSALLAGAGQQRARLLAALYKDERSQALEAFPLLEKMYVNSHQAMIKVHTSLYIILLLYLGAIGTCDASSAAIAFGDCKPS